MKNIILCFQKSRLPPQIFSKDVTIIREEEIERVRNFKYVGCDMPHSCVTKFLKRSLDFKMCMQRYNEC
jgi:hypothetical protein